MALKLSGLMKKGKNVNTKVCCSVVVAAAGASTRMEGQDKLFLDIGGTPVLAHTLTALNRCPEVSELVIVTRRDKLNDVAQLVAKYKISKVMKIIPGGQTRLESVLNGVLQVSPDAKLIAVHDGARPFVTGDIVAETVEAALQYLAAAPGVPVTSTVKMAKNAVVIKTVDRSDLFEVQTPQKFTAELLKGALQNACDKGLYITDDCMAVEALGCPVHLTAGARENIKLTTATDIAFAEAIFKMRGI